MFNKLLVKKIVKFIFCGFLVVSIVLLVIGILFALQYVDDKQRNGTDYFYGVENLDDLLNLTRFALVILTVVMALIMCFTFIGAVFENQSWLVFFGLMSTMTGIIRIVLMSKNMNINPGFLVPPIVMDIVMAILSFILSLLIKINRRDNGNEIKWPFSYWFEGI